MFADDQGCTVVLTKKVWERIQKSAILKHLPTHFKAKREKGVGTPFPSVPSHYTPADDMCIQPQCQWTAMSSEYLR